MSRSKLVRAALAAGLPFMTLFLIWATTNTPVKIARGKSPAQPIAEELSPEQQRAQDLALSDARVQSHTVGRSAEVFGVRRVVAKQFTPAAEACRTADCRQVEIYVFDEDAAVLALVNLDNKAVLDVLYQPGIRPGINRRLAERAMEVALNAPEVIEALGFRPLATDMPPIPSGVPGRSCEEGHYCVAPTFEQNGRFLWAIVDLTTETLAGVHWGQPLPSEQGNAAPSLPEGCPQPGSVDRDGWTLNYATTGSDGLRVDDVRYEGRLVLTSVKHVEWHVDYHPSFGFVDEPGCGAGGGGYQIPAFGETQVITLTDETGASIGFELVQDFRNANWGNNCNYRYENRLQFYADGRFRIASAAYGRGCDPQNTYRAVVRIDVAVNGDDGDTFSYLADDGWRPVLTETYRTPYGQAEHGPHVYGHSNRAWAVFDAGGSGYHIVGDVGQYPQSRGAAPFFYVTQYHAEEGETDMGALGDCCFDDHRQGPEHFVNGEDVTATNLVLWYVPQMVTQADSESESNDYYCWTVSGEPDPETYPCIVGPMFVPFSGPFTYHFPLAVRD